MRVIHVITRLIVGGAQENTVATVLGLREKAGVSVQLVSGPTNGPEGSLESAVKPIPGLFHLEPFLTRPVHPGKDWLALRRLRRLFAEQQPDIVHTHSGKAGILGRIAARRAGVPVIVHTIHGPSFGPFQGPMANWLFRAAERYAAPATTHFITVAHSLTQAYLAAGISRPEHYTRILSGFPLAPYLAAKNDVALRRKHGLTPQDFVAGKIARLARLKGHDDLLNAAPKLVARCPRIRFLLVGDGPWRNRLQQMVDALGLSRHFIFTGLVRPEEVPRYVGIMDVLVHLSLREGLPRSLPQALAAGKPVIAYDCDGAREICINDQTGYLLPPGDVWNLCDRLLQLADAPAERERLGRQGQALVKEWFPVQRMVEEIYRLYCKLWQDHRDRRGSAAALQPQG